MILRLVMHANRTLGYPDLKNGVSDARTPQKKKAKEKEEPQARLGSFVILPLFCLLTYLFQASMHMAGHQLHQ